MSENRQARIRKQSGFAMRSLEYQKAALAEHGPQSPTIVSHARELIEAIDVKRIDWFIERNNGMWESMWRAFEADTNIRLPKTQKGIGEALRNWAGSTVYDAAIAARDAARAESLRQAEERHAGFKLELSRRAASAMNVNFNGTVLPGDKWVDQMLAAGWEIRNRSHTKIPSYCFVQKTQFVALRDAVLSGYARQKAAHVAQPQAIEISNVEGHGEAAAPAVGFTAA